MTSHSFRQAFDRRGDICELLVMPHKGALFVFTLASQNHMWVRCRHVRSQVKPRLACTTNGTKMTAHPFLHCWQTPTGWVRWRHVSGCTTLPSLTTKAKPSQSKPHLACTTNGTKKRRHTHSHVFGKHQHASQVEACIQLQYIALTH